MVSTPDEFSPPNDGDLHESLEIPPGEAEEGVKKQITIRQPRLCLSCNGDGSLEDEKTTCPKCQGKGTVQKPKELHMSEGYTTKSVSCPRCRGSEEITKSCGDCSGQGKVIDERTLEVEIPAGVDHGQTLRLQDERSAIL